VTPNRYGTSFSMPPRGYRLNDNNDNNIVLQLCGRAAAATATKRHGSFLNCPP